MSDCRKGGESRPELVSKLTSLQYCCGEDNSDNEGKFFHQTQIEINRFQRIQAFPCPTSNIRKMIEYSPENDFLKLYMILFIKSTNHNPIQKISKKEIAKNPASFFENGCYSPQMWLKFI